MWSADGRALFYVSDRSDAGNKNGAQNIWTTTPGRSDAKRVSSFTEGRVLWPSISYDGREVVFEHNFAIWKLDTANGKTSEVAITRRGASAGPAVERQRLSDQISEMQLSPDGKKVAFVVRGEVFAASASATASWRRRTARHRITMRPRSRSDQYSRRRAVAR